MDSLACNVVAPEEAEAFVLRAVERLKQLGMRITEPRRMVLKVLATTRKPLGAYQIRDRVLESGGRIDVASVYRILASLVESHLAHHIGAVDGYLACSSPHVEGEIQHLICEDCGCVEELSMPSSVSRAIDAALGGTGFESRVTRVEVQGVCDHCQSARAQGRKTRQN